MWPFKTKPKPYKDEPCFVLRHGNEIIKSTLRTFSGGQHAVTSLIGEWMLADSDGTIPDQRLYSRWWRP